VDVGKFLKQGKYGFDIKFLLFSVIA